MIEAFNGIGKTIVSRTEEDKTKPLRQLTASDLAAMIDVSAVQAFNTEQDIHVLAEIAGRTGFIMAHALPHFVPLLRSLLPRGGRTLVGGPVGFPSGGHTTATKIAEAEGLIRAGAEELDLMMNIGRLKSGDLNYVQQEVSTVVKAVAPIPLKVIIEVGYLTDDEIRQACNIIVSSGAAFVKTGSGWTLTPPSIERIALIANTVQGAVQIKASGGIRDLNTVARMVALGVTRFGINTQAAVELVEHCAALPNGALVIPKAL
jgi:deoxyribose-phosphate aldolase